MKPRIPHTEESRLFAKQTLAELFGETNKTPEAQKRDREAFWAAHPAIDLRDLPLEQRAEHHEHYVAVPADILAELQQAIFPLTPDQKLYFEHLMKRHHQVTDPQDIEMDALLVENGSMGHRYQPEAALGETGFTYYHE